MTIKKEIVKELEKYFKYYNNHRNTIDKFNLKLMRFKSLLKNKLPRCYQKVSKLRTKFTKLSTNICNRYLK